MRPGTCPNGRAARGRARCPCSSGATALKGQRAAVRYADIYSCYVEERAVVDEVAPRLASMEAICAELGRDPSSIGRSVGVSVRPLEAAGFRPDIISGSPDEIAAAFRTFRDAGFTQLEIMFGPGTMEALEALAPVVDAISAD